MSGKRIVTTSPRGSWRKRSNRLMFEPLEPRIVLDAYAPGSGLVISEFMALNDGILADENGNYSDWIELHNPAAETLSLNGWFLTDDDTDLTQWQFPDVSLPPRGYLVVFASNNDRTDPAGELHTNFKLSGGGEYLGLVRPDGTTVEFAYSPEFPQQFDDVSYGLSPDLTARGYFLEPTPRAANDETPIGNPTWQVAISEIMYHTASESDLEEYVELVNLAEQPVSVENWRFTDGIEFTFPDVTIAPGEYLVVAADVPTFSAKYPDVTNVVGGWTGRLSNRGERIELLDLLGGLVDQVRYADQGVWASREIGPADYGHRGWVWTAEHDGGVIVSEDPLVKESRSLELINAAMSNDYGQNWTASLVAEGTPGAANSVVAGDLPPFIADVGHGPIIPRSTDPVTVTARLIDEQPTGTSAVVYYRVDGDPGFTASPMVDDGSGGDVAAGDGVFTTVLPAQADGAVVEFYVEAIDVTLNVRSWPAAAQTSTDPLAPVYEHATNALYQVDDTFDPDVPWVPGSQPVYYLLMTEAERAELEDIGDGGFGGESESNAQMNATFIVADGGGVEVRYNVGIRNRGHGSRSRPPNNYRVNFVHDSPLSGVTRININSKYTHSQLIGSVLHRMAGNVAPRATAVQVRVNGEDLAESGSRMYGTYVAIEVRDGDFTARNFPDDPNGNSYKMLRDNGEADLAYEGPDPDDYRDSYLKETNEDYDDFSDVIHLTDVLTNAPEETYLEAVAEVVNVDQWMRYLALDALMLNLETGLNRGYGDDYALYRGNVDQRFILVPHDLDTLLNLGSTRRSVNETIFRFTEVAGLESLLNHPDVAPLFYGAFLDLIDTFFNPEVLNPLFDQVLGGFVPETTISAMKQFVVDRTAGVLAQIPQELTVQSALPVVGGYPLSAYNLAVLDGTAHSAETRSVLVGGELAEWSPRDGTWTVGQITGSAVLLAEGSEWKYLDDGSDQAADWFAVAFVDDAWKSGSAQLGYGEGDERTVVGYGDDPEDRHITTYFRKSFEVDDPSRFTEATLGLLRDDGAVVYLNGTRLLASNMPPGPIDYQTEATNSTSGSAEDRFFEYAVDPSLLLAAPALNLLAVEVHQIHNQSADLSFDLQLTGTTVGTGPVAGVPLNPGINRIAVQTFDAPGGTGNELDRSFIDVWYDDGSVEVAGSIADDVTWDPDSGPYRVTGDLTVADGATLTILPGTTVFFDANARLTVNGRLDAQGSQHARIRMTAYPGGGPWAGILFDYPAYSDQVSQLAFVDVEYSDAGSEAVETDNAQLVLENVHFGRHGVQYLNLHDSSVIVRDSVFPDVTDVELIHYLGFPDDGYALFDGNYFGSTTGYNDIIDFTGGQRPRPLVGGPPFPIARFTNNYFSGGSDDGLDMDSADAHIEGNVFTHFHQDDSRESKSHAVSTGTENGHVSQITVVGNLFYDVDHAVLIKDGGFGMIVNNTIVGVHKTHADATAAAVNLYEARDGQWQGDGAYLDGNIFYDVDRLFENPDPLGHPSAVTVNNSIIYPAPLDDTVPWTGTGNLDVDPQLLRTTGVTDPRIDFQLLGDSPAAGSGPNGQDMGGLVRGGATISGEPPAVTTGTTATLAIGGPHVYGYKYRLNGGPWSGPRGLVKSVDAIMRTGDTATVTLPGHGYAAGNVVDLYGASMPEYNGTFTVAAVTTDTFNVSVVGSPASPAEGTIIVRRHEPIELTGLADGDYTVEVLALNSAGIWQPEIDANSSQTWTVDTALVQLQINEVLAVNVAAVEHEGTWPDLIELINHGAATVDLAGMSITDNAAAPRRFVFPAGTLLAPGEYLVLYADNPAQTSGIHLGFSLDGDGEGVYLYNTAAAGGAQIDAVEFGLQLPDLSIGRTGRDGNWTLTEPTFSTASLAAGGTANLARPTGNPATLKINEWFSDGDVRLSDDFIELFNPDPSPVALGGLFLTDNPITQVEKHRITPLSFIAGSGYAVFAADGRPGINAGHVDFKLSLEGELIGLYDADLIEIDKVIYLPQTTDFSQGRSPDAGPRFSAFRLPTPGLPNPGALSTTRLIRLDDPWRYDASGDDLGTAWRAPGYDDSLWDFQPAVFGLEDDALPATINTPLELGPITYYFRTRFTVDGDPQGVTLEINTLLDDGAIIYLNGEPAEWIRMDETGVDYRTRANGSIGDAYFEGPFSIPTTFLQSGENVLAVEVHQTSSGSSDVVFGLTLDASAPIGDSQMLNTGLELIDGLRITEMMYNPIENDDLEFVELQNVGGVTLDLAGVRLADAISFTFPPMLLAPGESVVVVRDLEEFETFYGPGINVVGQYSGNLSNGGEDMVLQLPAPLEAAALRFEYDDLWHPTTDGGGFALEIADPATRPSRYSDAASWQPGTIEDGTPGTDDGLTVPTVVINEVLSHTDFPLLDSIELHNVTGTAINIGGWYLSDSVTSSNGAGNWIKYRIAADVMIPANGYLVFDEDHFNPTPLEPGPNDFALDGAHGDDVWLVAANAEGYPTGVVDHVTFGAQVNAQSWGRVPDGSGPLYPMETLSLISGANGNPWLGEVILSEIHYNPGTMADADDLEFVEIYNTTGVPVELAHWRLRKGVDFDFGDGRVLGSYATLAVVPFDPAAEPDKLAAFTAHHNVQPGVVIVGPYDGQLSDTGERVQLQRPDLPPSDEPDFYPGLLEDEAIYDDEGAWPAADGTGDSLDRTPGTWGNDATSWTAALPTPGVVESGPHVAGRHIFYNFSSFDGNDPGANATDDAAIATDKTALLPGQTATFANYTSYSRGINGIMIDLAQLADGIVPTADDFLFRTGNDDTPGGWTPVTSFVVDVRAGAGRGGSDRVTITLDDLTVRNTWLEVTVLSAGLALPGDDIFYFGNAVAEAGNASGDARVTAADLLLARNNPRSSVLQPAAVDFAYDYDRDGDVNATDVLLARNNQTNFLDNLRLIDLSVAESPAAAEAELAWLIELSQDTSSTSRDPQRTAVDAVLATYWQ